MTLDALMWKLRALCHHHHYLDMNGKPYRSVIEDGKGVARQCPEMIEFEKKVLNDRSPRTVVKETTVLSRIAEFLYSEGNVCQAKEYIVRARELWAGLNYQLGVDGINMHFLSGTKLARAKLITFGLRSS